MFQEHPLAHDRARYAQGGIPWNSYSSVCPKTSLWSMRVYWMKVHMRFCECACLRGGCVWRQSVWVWVHSCRDDVTSWKLIYSAYRWGHWFLELGSGSLNEEFPAVMASCYGALRFLCVSVCVCAGVWGGGGCTNSTYQQSYSAQARLPMPPLLLCMRIPWCHFSFRHRGSQVTPPLCHSVNTHTLTSTNQILQLSAEKLNCLPVHLPHMKWE